MASPLQPLCPEIQAAFCGKHKDICAVFDVRLDKMCSEAVTAIHNDCEDALRMSEGLDGSRLCPMIIDRLKKMPPSWTQSATTACESIVQNAAAAWKAHESSAPQDMCLIIENGLYKALQPYKN